jgi:ATP-dependent RNA helicase UAP56/SUB2
LADNPKPVSVLVMSPFKLLSYQIQKEFARFTKYLPEIRTEVMNGGIPIQE